MAYAFHDYKKLGADESALRRWMKDAGWQALLNTQGTTWRLLPDDAKAAVTDEKSALALMLESPSIIRRPVAEWEGGRIIGWDEAAYGKAFG